MPRQKVLTARFYATASGSMPVREWLLSLNKQDRIDIGSDIANIEFNWPIGPPQCKPLEDGIFEVRSHISSSRIARVLFFARNDHFFCCMVSSKKAERHPDKNWNWLKNENKKWRTPK